MNEMVMTMAGIGIVGVLIYKFYLKAEYTREKQKIDLEVYRKQQEKKNEVKK